MAGNIALRKIIPFWFLLFLVLVFFYKVWQGKVLLPADIVARLQPWRAHSAILFPDFKKVYNPLLDVILYFYPWRVLLERSLRGGFIPLWNPYNFCGQPFLANMASACLYPFNWLLLFLSSAWLMTLTIILHFILTAIFAYLFFISLLARLQRARSAPYRKENKSVALPQREQGEPPVYPALLATITWTFSGPLVVWAEYQTPMQSMSWFPLSLYLWQVFWEKRNYLYALLSGIPLSLSILAGHTQFALYGWIAFLAFGIFRSKEEENLGRGFIGLGLAIGLGLLLSAPQLLPSLELALRSHRSLGTSFEELIATSFPLRHLFTFLIPNFYGNPVDYDYRGAFNYVELTGYFGIVPLFMLPFALKLKEGRFFFILGLSFLLFSLSTPLLRLFSFLPIFSFLAAPARSLYILCFSFSAIAGIGAQNLFVSQRQMRKSFKEGKVSGYLLLSLFFLVALGLATEGPLFGIPSPRYLFLFLLISSLCFLLIWLRKVKLLLALAILDLFSFGITFNPAMPPSMLFPPLPITDYISGLKDKGRFLALPGVRDPLDTLLPESNLVLGLKEVQGGDSVYPLRFLKFAEMVEGKRIRSNAIYFSNVNSPLLNLMSVRYLVSRRQTRRLPDQREGNRFIGRLEQVARPIREPKANEKVVRPLGGRPTRLRVIYHDYDHKGMYILENEGALPEIYMVGKTLCVKDGDTALREITRIDAEKEVVLEGGRALVHLRWTRRLPDQKEGTRVDNGELKYSIRKKRERAGLLEVVVRTNKEGYLIWTDAFYPGWRGEIDGKKEEILPANFLFKALRVPRGEHLVRFIYQPFSFKLGLYMGLWGVLALTLTILLYAKLSPRRIGNN